MELSTELRGLIMECEIDKSSHRAHPILGVIGGGAKGRDKDKMRMRLWCHWIDSWRAVQEKSRQSNEDQSVHTTDINKEHESTREVSCAT